MKKKINTLLLSSALLLSSVGVSVLASCGPTAPIKYQIDIKEVSGVKLSIDKVEASKDEEVKISVISLQNGKLIKAIKVNDSEAKKISDTEYSFLMPEENVTISAVIEDAVYKISVEEVEGVELKVNGNSIGGEVVSIEVIKCPEGKKVTAINGVDATKTSDNKFEFVMPFNDVTIKAVLETEVYEITKDESNGVKITLSKESAVFKETLSVSVVPPTSKRVVTLDLGDDCNLVKVSENEFTFDMPSRNVVVKVILEDATYIGTINVNKEIFSVGVKDKDGKDVSLNENEKGYTFTLVADLDYTLKVTNFDAEIYTPAVKLNGSDTELVENSLVFTALRSNLIIDVEYNVIKHNLNYESNDVEIEGNLTEASKNSIINLTVKESEGREFTSILVYSGVKNEDSYKEMEVSSDQTNNLKYSFTMGNEDVTIEVTFNRLNANVKNTNVNTRRCIDDSKYLDNGEWKNQYLNSEQEIPFGVTLRIYLKDYVVTDKDSNSHLYLELTGFKVGGVNLEIQEEEVVEDEVTTTKKYVEFVVNKMELEYEVEAIKHPTIATTVTLEGLANVETKFYDSKDLASANELTNGLFDDRKQYINISVEEGYELTSVKAKYSQYEYVSGYWSSGFQKKDYTVDLSAEDGLYVFDPSISTHWDDYCAVEIIITTQKHINYEGKSFVGNWTGNNIYSSNTRNTSLQSCYTNFEVKSNGEVYKSGSKQFLAENLDEENGVISSAIYVPTTNGTGGSNIKEAMRYGVYTSVVNDTTNVYDRDLLCKIPEGKTKDDVKSASLMFGGSDGRGYTVTQFFLNDGEGNYNPYAAVYVDNIQDIVYNDCNLVFSVGTQLGVSDTTIFEVKKNNETIVTIKSSSDETKLLNPEDLISRSIDVSGVTGCTVTPNKATALNGEKVILTISDVPTNKRIYKVFANSIECTLENDGTYSFTCPNEDVIISVTLKDVHTITSTSTNATITTDKTSAIEGEEVHITISDIPSGKAVDTVIVSGGVTVTGSGTSYSFIMPDTDVSISVTLKDYVIPDTPVSNKTYSGTRSWYDYDDYDSYEVTETFSVTFGSGNSITSLTLSNGSDSYNGAALTYDYVQPASGTSFATITIHIDSSTTLTIKYWVEDDDMTTQDDVTIGSTTYYCHSIHATLVA